MSPKRAVTKVVLLSALAFAVTGIGASRARGAPLSPSTVLAKVDEKLGAQMVGFPYVQPGTSEGDDRTLAPFFYVAGGDPETERLPLKETSAEAHIAGVIAKVKVRQVFENTGTKPIEAVYVFPASTRAAVHGMRMRIGDRTVQARIERRAQARAEYEQAKQTGRRASLLEQERPNVFTMNVANIMPRDRIEVELDYSELLVPEDAVYEFVYPTVVGPRYGGGAHPQKDRWIANPYLEQGEPEPYRFGIRVHLETGIPIKQLASPSHKLAVSYRSPSSADVALAAPGGGDRDFVLRYRLAGDRVETGLLLYETPQENYFLLMMEPPQRPRPAEIPPREYVFLLDVSGSMHGFPLDTAKALMKDLLRGLRPHDYFNVALFSGASYVMNPTGSVPATPGNVQVALELIGRQQGGGGTELMGGLKAAYGIPQPGRGISRTVVVVTDGYVGVEAQTFKFIRERLDRANVFAFGIGSSVNRALIEGMARAGQGEPFVVLKPARAREQADKLRRYIEAPVLANIGVGFKGLGAYDVAPRKLPDLMARRPVVLFGKYQGDAKGAIEISGYTGGGRFVRRIAAAPAAVGAANAPIRYLWARKWVATLSDELHLAPGNRDLEQAITELGLSYNLLTSFTSFVAVDSEVANRSGMLHSVKQPLPLPAGVSNYAVGGAATATPAPAAPLTRSMPMRAAEHRRSAGSSGYGRGHGSGGLRGRLAQAAPAKTKADDRADRDRDARFRVLTVSSHATGLPKPADVLRAVERAIAQAVPCATAAAQVRIRLTVDASGRVTKVEIHGAPPALGACLRRRLAGVTTAARPTGAGTLELTIRFLPV